MQNKQLKAEKNAFSLIKKQKNLHIIKYKNQALDYALVKKNQSSIKKTAIGRNKAFLNFHIIYEEKWSFD